MRSPIDPRRSWLALSLAFLGIVLCTLVLANPMPVHAQAGKVFEQAFIWGVGPPVAEAGEGRIPGFGYSAPFEDLRLKN